MRGAQRSLVFALATIVPMVSLLLGAHAQQPTGSAASDPAPRVQKNPKLSTPIATLRSALPQAQGKITTRTVTPPPNFAVENLPKSLQDAIRAGRMQINKNAEVQAFIEVTGITPARLATLQSLGVKIQIIGVPDPDKTRGEVLTKI